MVVIENIQIKLDLLTSKFNKQMDKSRAKMSKLNKTMLQQKEKLGIVNSKIRDVTNSIADQKNINGKNMD